MLQRVHENSATWNNAARRPLLVRVHFAQRDWTRAFLQWRHHRTLYGEMGCLAGAERGQIGSKEGHQCRNGTGDSGHAQGEAEGTVPALTSQEGTAPGWPPSLPCLSSHISNTRLVSLSCRVWPQKHSLQHMTREHFHRSGEGMGDLGSEGARQGPRNGIHLLASPPFFLVGGHWGLQRWKGAASSL